jgi:NADH-quinone oxidoreductase chain G
MVNIFIDGLPVEVTKGTTILQACSQIGIDIPRFCYHERLSIAGNCRMCLVEVEKSPKPVASCAMPVLDNMKIFTNTPLVRKAREGVMEFLLVNHPLDCPICDQGGECDLQDLSMVYGSDRGRFHEYKRGVEDKNLGPLVKTVMTRCIHCTRCVRFATEVAGVPDLGTVGRGRDTEISTYIEKVFNSELSGNIIDLCPVGALTSKPYAFTARSWELKSTESIDLSDAVGSNIRIDSRGSEIMRILPKLNEDVNEEWISDKTRFSYDGLKRQRLTEPMIKINGKHEVVSWKKAFKYIWDNIKPRKENIIGVIGNLADAESIQCMKTLFSYYETDHRVKTSMYLEANTPLLTLTPQDVKTRVYPSNARTNYLFNTTISRIEESDLCLLIGTNTRIEAPMINLRLRKRFLQGGFHVASIGPKVNLTYDVEDLGNDITTLLDICEGKHAFNRRLLKARNPMIIVGTSIINRPDSSRLLRYIQKLSDHAKIKTDNWNGFNTLHTGASTVGALQLGIGFDKIVVDTTISPERKKTVAIFPQYYFDSFVYLLGADEIRIREPEKHFIVYQGHHGDYGANIANVILPGSAFTEKNGTYCNTEGRLQFTRKVFKAPGNAREDYKIICALSQVVKKQINFNPFVIKLDFPDVMVSKRLIPYSPLLEKKEVHSPLSRDQIDKTPIKPLIENFYLTNSIARASQIMAKCSKLYKIN